MNVAVVGCGNISRLHIKAIKENLNLNLVAVCDIKKNVADGKALETGAKSYYDFDTMLQNEKIDCVHICTPHYLHTDFALKAINYGVNVLIEKPCSVNFEEIEKLIDAQISSGLSVGVCFQNRYNACVIKAKSIIDNNELGALKCLRAFVTWNRQKEYYSDDWHGTLDKECGGVLINQSIHTIDLLQFLAGGCESVIAHTFNDHLKGVIEVEDTATLLMKLKNNVNAVMYATTAYAEDSDVIIEASLENGKIRIEGDKLYITDENGILHYQTTGELTQCIGQKYWGTGHTALINDFYDCLEFNKKFSIDAVEGAKAARIVAQCYDKQG